MRRDEPAEFEKGDFLSFNRSSIGFVTKPLGDKGEACCLVRLPWLDKTEVWIPHSGLEIIDPRIGAALFVLRYMIDLIVHIYLLIKRNVVIRRSIRIISRTWFQISIIISIIAVIFFIFV